MLSILRENAGMISLGRSPVETREVMCEIAQEIETEYHLPPPGIQENEYIIFLITSHLRDGRDNISEQHAAGSLGDHCGLFGLWRLLESDGVGDSLE